MHARAVVSASCYLFTILSICLAQWHKETHAAEALTEQSNLISAEEKRISLAQEYFDHAVNLSSDVSLIDGAELSLPFYRAAARLNPIDSVYQEALGTIEEKLGLLKLSVKRLQKASKLQCRRRATAGVCDALQSIDDHQKRGNVQPIAELSFQYQPFDESTLLSPFIIRNFSGQANWIHLSLPDLVSIFGNHSVEAYPQNMLSKPTRLFTMQLHDAVAYIDLPEGAYVNVDASNPGMYIQWNINSSTFRMIEAMMHNQSYSKSVEAHLNVLVPDIQKWLLGSSSCLLQHHESDIDVHHDVAADTRWMEEFMHNLHWNMILIGEEDAGMFLHKDDLSLSSWQVQMKESKHWFLCSPNTSEEAMSSIDYFAQAGDESGSGWGRSCYSGVVNERDLIYYPAGWWHQTINRPISIDMNDHDHEHLKIQSSTSMAISGSILGPKDAAAAFFKEMEEECKHLFDCKPAGGLESLEELVSPRYRIHKSICHRLRYLDQH